MRLIAIFLFFLSLFFSIATSPVLAATSKVGLGTVSNFAILGGSAVNDTNPSVITGNVGLSPAAWLSALTCLEVTGTIYSVDGSGPLPCRTPDAGLLTIAQNDLTTAYNDAAARVVTSTIGTELGGATLLDGVYNSASTTFEISADHTLTLDGGGNADSVFIFKMGTTLTTFGNSKVVLTNGAQACNVFWQVGSSAVLGSGTSFIGNIMADQSITDNGGSTVNGRFLARIAAVTLNNTTISKSTCTTTSGSTSGSSSSSSTTGITVCPPITNVTPIIIESKRISPTSIFVSWGPYSGTDRFSVRYGLASGSWPYNTNVTGFSTTINALPPNQPVWIAVAVKNDCSIGTYGQAKLTGGPGLPNTGHASAGVFDRFLPLLFLHHSESQNQMLSQLSPQSPTRLVIPAIGVNANIQDVDVTTRGEMEVPKNPANVGLFDLGPRPGEKGSAVIAGHLDTENGQTGVFSNLNRLKPGDKLYIENGGGASLSFVVRGSQIFDPGYADEVFGLSGGTHLNLITCDGVWDGSKKNYNKRLVIFADAIN